MQHTEHKKKRMFLHHPLINVAYTFVVLLVALVAFLSIASSVAWFADNRTATADGMQVTAAKAPYELACRSVENKNLSRHFWEFLTDGSPVSVETLHKGKYNAGSFASVASEKTTLDPKISLYSTKSCTSIRWWMDGETGDMKDLKNKTGAIEPGSSGKLTFYLIVNEPSSSALCSLELAAYRGVDSASATEFVTDGTRRTPVVPVTDQHVLSLLSRHVLLFADYDETTKQYSNWLSNSHFTVDLSNVQPGEAIEITVYWIWPEYIDQFTLVDEAIRLSAPMFDKDGADYALFQQDLIDHYAWYFSSTGNSLTIDENLLNSILDARVAYNAADTDIGSVVDFLQAKITVG